jgi:predicted permease
VLVLALISRAAQGLRLAPGFTALCVLTLGVAIGADTAVFSLVDAVLLRPLPYPRADRLVGLWHTLPALGLKQVGQSDATYLLYRAHRHALAEMAIYRAGLVNLTGGDAPERVPSARVTSTLFTVLGVAPVLGRGFAAAEERPGAPPVAVLSDRLWRRRLGGDRRALGRTVRIDGMSVQVIGVMPAGFAFPDLDTALWLPLAIDPAKAAAGALNYDGVGRLAPGVTPAAAAAELNAMARRLDRWLPGTDAKIMVASGFAALVRPLRDDVVGEVGKALWLLFGAVGCILVIACANVANLLIVRGDGRRHELAVYTALGAPRRRLIGGVLAESLLLGLGAGIAGVLLAWGGLGLLASLRPAVLARLAPASIDLRTLGFAAAVALVTGLLFGVVPAWRSSRVEELAAELKGGGRAMTMGLDGAPRHADRAGPGGGRALRLRLLPGRAARLRDRRPHGARGHRGRHPLAGGARGAGGRRRRPRRRAGGGGGAGRPDRGAAVRGQAPRPARVLDRAAAAGDDDRARQLPPSRPRRPRRAAHGLAAPGIAIGIAGRRAAFATVPA